MESGERPERDLPRLVMARRELLELLDEQISRGWDLYHHFDQLTDDESGRQWTHAVERWDALTREGLRSAYSTDGPADEFFEAATGGIVRFVDQTDADTFTYRREGIEAGVHTLESLKERLRFVPDADDRAMTARDDAPRETVDRDSRLVMVVYGRNELATQAMFAFLSSMGLRPIDWETAVSLAGGGSPHNLVAVKAAMASAQAVVVMFTPDDLARLRPDLVQSSDGQGEENPQGQPRPNVLIESGMALMADSERTILVEMGDLRGASDLAGLNTVRLSDDPDRRAALRSRLQRAGCTVDEDNRWLSVGAAGNFDSAVPTEPADAESSERPAENIIRQGGAAVPATPPDAGPALRERYEQLQAAVDRYVETHSQIDQPLTAESLHRSLDDATLDYSWATSIMEELVGAGRIHRNPDGEGYYPAT